MTKKIVWTAAVVALLGILAFSWAPYGIQRYVESNYPGVKIGSVKLGTSHLTFRDVSVTRLGIQATIDQITVDRHRNVSLNGGRVTVDLNAMKSDPKSSDQNTGSVVGQNLAVTVRKGEHKATLQGAGFNSSEVCFKSAYAGYKGYWVDVQDGCVDRRGESLKAGTVLVEFDLPFPIPKMGVRQEAHLTQVRASLYDSTRASGTKKEVKLHFVTASLGAHLKILQPSEVLLRADDFQAKIKELWVDHPWVSPEPVTFKQITAVLDPERKFSGYVGFGGAGIWILDIEGDATGANSCNDWVEALPEPLPLALQQAKRHFTGNLSFDVQVKPVPNLKIKNSCRYTCSEEPIRSLKSIWSEGKSFSYMAYDRNNNLFERKVGPNAGNWTYLSTLPPHIPKAFITLEDPGFEHHNGIIPQALVNSFRDNLQLGKFFRGGSTISMQLTKNIWLRRHKTLGRKVHEFLLTSALESCLTKAQILELYLNVVEFGPDLYGIGPAAKHYFQKTPNELEPDEAFYLASILPKPRKAVPPQEGGLVRVRGLMKTLAARGFISEHLVPVQEDAADPGWETE